MADSTERNFDLNPEHANESSSSQSGADQADAGFADTELTESGIAEAETVTPDSEGAVPAVVGEDGLTETDEERAAREAEEELLWIFQATVFDQTGQKIGRVGQVYLDDTTQAPNWVTVKTGLFGMKEFFIPLDNSERAERRITVPYDKATVLASPRTEVDQNLSPSEEDALYNHYQVEGKTSDVVALDVDGVEAPGESASDVYGESEPMIASESELTQDQPRSQDQDYSEYPVPASVSGAASEFDALISEDSPAHGSVSGDAPVPAAEDEVSATDVFANPDEPNDSPFENPANDQDNDERHDSRG